MLFRSSSDAVITIGGRIGSLHEFVTAVESRKPCGVLLGSGGAADAIPGIMELEPHFKSLVVYDEDPVKLVEKIVQILDKESKDIKAEVMKDEHWFLEPNDREG